MTKRKNRTKSSSRKTGSTARKGHPLPTRGAQSWQLVCDQETFDRLRGDQAFHRLLDLARHINGLRYAISAAASANGDDTPNGDRQRFGTFYYLGGVLFEAFRLLPQLRPHFENTQSWKEGFAHFGDDNAILSRVKQGGDLHRLRNHTSFHFLPMVSAKSLSKLRLDEYTFTSGFGPQSGFVYHNLADAVGMHYLAGAPSDGTDFGAEAERLAKETRDLALEYVKYGSNLIGQALLSFGFKTRGSISRSAT